MDPDARGWNMQSQEEIIAELSGHPRPQTLIVTRRDDKRTPPNWWYEVAVETATEATVIHTDGFYEDSMVAYRAACAWIDRYPEALKAAGVKG
jgi:hypothetical protein